MSDAETVFKDELLLMKSVYNTNATRKNLEALAQTIQNIIIFERGTYPNQPDLGLGIENYQFEFLDDKTIYELRNGLDTQIQQFIPTSIKIDFNIDILENDLGKKVLFFNFKVTNLTSYSDTTDEINMLFGTNTDNTRVISKIIL